jgi:hypothetical protein
VPARGSSSRPFLENGKNGEKRLIYGGNTVNKRIKNRFGTRDSVRPGNKNEIETGGRSDRGAAEPQPKRT